MDALATSSDAVLSASGRTLRFRRGAGTEQQIDSLMMSHSVSAIAYDSVASRWWVATDSQLVQVSSENGKLAATIGCAGTAVVGSCDHDGCAMDCRSTWR